MASQWKSTDDISEIGKGITLLVTLVPERKHALVRFDSNEPSEEERAAIQFANKALPIDPDEEEIMYKGLGKFLVVPIESVKYYQEFGFKLKYVPLPRHKVKKN